MKNCTFNVQVIHTSGVETEDRRGTIVILQYSSIGGWVQPCESRAATQKIN